MDRLEFGFGFVSLCGVAGAAGGRFDRENTHMHAHISAHIYVRVSVCLCVRMFVCIYSRTQTLTYEYIEKTNYIYFLGSIIFI